MFRRPGYDPAFHELGFVFRINSIPLLIHRVPFVFPQFMLLYTLPGTAQETSMTTSAALATVDGDQKRWSRTAVTLRRGIDQARRIVLWLSVLGAVLETLAAQVAHVAQINQIRPATASHSGLAMLFGYLGAASLAMAAVVRQSRLGHERTQAAILCRSGSESLKRELYRYRTQTGNYSSANADLELLNRRDQILDKLKPYQQYIVDPPADTPALASLDAAAYLNERITGPNANLKFYADRSGKYKRRLTLLNSIQFFLAILGALLGVAVTITGTQTYAAWVAVITTISGALGAHALAQRYEQLTVTYRATAQRLEGAVARWKAAGTNRLTDLVEGCESILLEENQAWIAGADQQ
jgi:hypothetical protein